MIKVSLREGEVDPSVAEDLPVALGDVVEAGDEARVHRRLDRQVPVRPRLLDKFQGPQDRCPLKYRL